MPTDQANGFIDNWAYLKAELQWLDRVLMLAVARQKKETKEIDRTAHSKADRATSHWWKGIVTLEGTASYDEYRQPQQIGMTKPSQQQQIEQQIQASRQQGVMLALPHLCDRLQLTAFEKNLVLMSLAPELNRRYPKLYRFLRAEETAVQTDLPSLDLVLRLFCRNDIEWRSARNRLTKDSPLSQYRLLQLLPSPEATRLNASLKLEDELIDYLVSEQPKAEDLEGLLSRQTPAGLIEAAQVEHLSRLDRQSVAWSDLVLPAPLLETLQYLSQQIRGHHQARALWNLEPQGSGKVVLLTGAAGTGRTTAAQAIAHSLQTPLFQTNLEQIEPEQYCQLLQNMTTQAPSVLLIDAAQLWLGRSSRVNPVALHQFLIQRRSLPVLTLLRLPPGAIRAECRSQIDRVLTFPLPNESDRLKLWKRAFPPQVPLAGNIAWKTLAKQLLLTGGEIQTIAQEAVRYAAAQSAAKVEMQHLQVVLAQRGKAIKTTPKARRRSSTSAP